MTATPTPRTALPVGIRGQVASGFEPVAAAFAENVERRGETGASCAVYQGGRLVADLWVARGADDAWTPETRTCVYSVSKGVTTICLLMAAERGLLDLDAAVSTYWPEFGAAGKASITVRQVLAHRAGLAWVDEDLSVEDLVAWTPVVDALAAQRPAWEPGTRYAYHAVTFGWLAGEVLRRTTGLRPSAWLREHVAEPLGLQMTFGGTVDDPGICPPRESLPVVDVEAAAAIATALDDPRAVRAMTLGGAIDVGDLFGAFARPELLAAEIPAANLVTNARSLARIYAATVGEIDGIRLLEPNTITDARRLQSHGEPAVGLDEGNRWGTGFMLSSPRRGMAGDGSFGHDGAGGHLAFAHPELEVAFGYHTSRPGGIPDDRAEALCAALRSCI